MTKQKLIAIATNDLTIYSSNEDGEVLQFVQPFRVFSRHDGYWTTIGINLKEFSIIRVLESIKKYKDLGYIVEIIKL